MEQQTTETPEKTETPDPQPSLVLASDEVAMAAPSPAAPLAAPGEPAEAGIMQLARMAEGSSVLEKAHQILLQVRRNALSLTGPGDWVAMKGKGEDDDQAVCMLRHSGALKVLPFFQVQVEPALPVGPQGEFAPNLEYGDDGEVQLTAWCWAVSPLTGGQRIRVTGRKSSTEQFIGRGPLTNSSQMVARGDLFQSLESHIFTKAVRNLSGLKALPIKELEELAGIKLSQLAKGSGFKTSAGRAASKVTSDDTKNARDKLETDIIRAVGGDKVDQARLLKKVTSSDTFGGFTEIDRVTEDWQVENAVKKLQTHLAYMKKDSDGNGGNRK